MARTRAIVFRGGERIGWFPSKRLAKRWIRRNYRSGSDFTIVPTKDES